MFLGYLFYSGNGCNRYNPGTYLKTAQPEFLHKFKKPQHILFETINQDEWPEIEPKNSTSKEEIKQKL